MQFVIDNLIMHQNFSLLRKQPVSKITVRRMYFIYTNESFRRIN